MSQNVLPRAPGDPPGRALRVALGLGLAAVFGCACDDRKVTRPPPLDRLLPGAQAPRTRAEATNSSAPSPRPEAPALSIDRPDEPALDPAAPAGDLRAEIDAFRDLPACVRAHRLSDPLLADSVDALGYDTFVSDSCRSLQALATQSTGPCAAMLSSALRRRCEEQVAMLTGQPALCPATERTAGVPERAPLCLAAARRDLRPCAALRGLDRATCEGLLAHDLARCGVDERCLRTLRRWATVLPVATYHAPHAGRVEVTVKLAAGGEPRSAELAREAEAGAVVVPRPGGVRLMLGDPRTFFVVDETAGGGLVLDLPAWPPGPAPVLLASPQARVTVRLNDHGVLELTRDTQARVVVDEAPTEPGRPLRLRVDATVGPTHAVRTVTWTVDTWLREGPSEVTAPAAASAPTGAVRPVGSR